MITQRVIMDSTQKSFYGHARCIQRKTFSITESEYKGKHSHSLKCTIVERAQSAKNVQILNQKEIFPYMVMLRLLLLSDVRCDPSI